MISLDKIVTSNLEMLKSQEAELLKSLTFVQKAKQLFQAHWGAAGPGITGKKRGRPAGKTKLSASPKKRGRKPGRKKKAAARKGKRVSHITNIMNVLKQHGKPMTSGDLISALFKKQNADKDIKHFRLLIYPVLTKAYSSKELSLKEGKIHLNK